MSKTISTGKKGLSPDARLRSHLLAYHPTGRVEGLFQFIRSLATSKEEEEVALLCLGIAEYDLEGAKALYCYVLAGSPVPTKFIAPVTPSQTEP